MPSLRSHPARSGKRRSFPQQRTLFLERLEGRNLLAADLVISEFMAQNGTGLVDEDGAFSDWIEIHNRSATTENLNGYFLTDSAGDLTKWRLPNVSIEAGGYLTVFADSKNRISPTAPLHTNFALSAGGEYLGLVAPDGSTIVHQFAPGFEEQVEDVSYGLAQQTATLVSLGAPLSYVVPTAGQAGLGDTWTQPGFNDASWNKTQTVAKSRLLLTEIGSGTNDFVEVQNVSGAALDTKDWFVVVNDATANNVNAVHSVTWSLPETFATAQVRYRTDSAGDNYWGSDIAWGTIGWAMIVDRKGQVVDFVGWGYSAAQLQTINVSVRGFTLTTIGAWSGNGSAAGGSDTLTLQRQGTADADTLVNFNYSSGISKGVQNTGLTAPFTATTQIPTTNALGYGINRPGFIVRQIDVNGGSNGTLDNTTEALAVLAGNFAAGAYNVTVDITAAAQTINFGGGLGNFPSDSPYLDGTSDTDLSDFAMSATATITIPVGTWTIGFASDDGGTLKLSGVNFFGESNAQGDTAGDGEVRYEGTRGHGWTSGRITVTGSPLTTTLDAMFFERGGGDSWEIAIRAGGGDANYLIAGGTLLSDGALGWSVVSPVSAGIETNVQTAMRNVNASVWTRVPFQVTDPAAYQSLILDMQYNDGFVAYLNGVQVASRNAPAALAWNSAATQARSASATTTSETINLTGFMNLLQPGANVLAFRGLNASAADNNFLLAPQLFGVTDTSDARFFATPTPGGPNRGSFVDFVASPTFSVAHGFYNAPFDLSLSTATPGATIRYTLNGTEPTETNGFTYAGPLAITGTTTLQVAAFRSGYRSPPAITSSYFFVADVIRQSPTGAAPAGFPSGAVNGQVLDYGMDPDIVNSPVWGPQVSAALTAIPSLSIVANLTDLFDPINGIYVNPSLDGKSGERATSLELIDPSGAEPGFQINAGLRIRGGYSRSPSNPKHSFRLFFRSEYGEAGLNYPLFGSEGATSFDKIDLRTSQNYSWSFEGSDFNTFTNDIFSREVQGAMGDPYSRGRYYHLYINGQYWGLYQTDERPGADFGSTYLGGNEEDWDTVKATGNDAGYTIEASDGNMDAWQALWNLSNQIATAPNQATASALFQQAQGNNPDGTRNPAYPVLLDTENLINYMLIIIYSGNKDAPVSNFLGNTNPNNWFGIRQRNGDKGFMFLAHDSEHTLLTPDLGINRNGPWPAGAQFQTSSPQWIHQQMMAVDDYRLAFADRAQKELIDAGGLLTPTVATARYLARANEIQLAIIAESARWGDAKSGVPKTKDTWQAAINNVVNNYFPQRAAIVVNQLKATTRWTNPMAQTGLVSAPLMPSINAPTYSQPAGPLNPGAKLYLDATTPRVYYTLDGTDPRLPSGAPSPTAVEYDPSITTQTLIAASATWKYRDTGVDLGTSWRDPAFNDSAWASGLAELGYGDGGEATILSFGPDQNNRYPTTYFRKSFTVTDLSHFTGLTVRLVRDDGAVVYLNGQEVVRSNMPTGTIGYGTYATTNLGNADESTFNDFIIPATYLLTGNNVLAVEVHQALPNSSDVSFNLALLARVATASPIALAAPTEVKARSYSSGEWSALAEAQFVVNTVPAAQGNVAITEVNYNPSAPSAAELAIDVDFTNNDFEFIELRNVGTQNVDLTGVKFTNGITFDFTGSPVTYLTPGSFAVVVKNAEAFAARYGAGFPVAGVYTGSLDNSGERIVLVDATATTIHDFVYDDAAPWPLSADGLGTALEVISVTGNYSAALSWRGSTETGGTPGALGIGNAAPTGIAITATTIAENASGGNVGLLSASDPDAFDTHTFALSDSRFEVVAQQLKLKAGVALDYETERSLTFTITATDNYGRSFARLLTLSVINVNEAPHSLTLSASSITEKQSGVMVGSASAVDDDDGDNVTFSTTDPRFTFVGGNLRLKPGEQLNYEAGATIAVTIRATDSSGLVGEQVFVLTVNDVAEAPTGIALSRTKVHANIRNAWAARVSVTDQDTVGTNALTVSDNRFTIVQNELYLKPGVQIASQAGTIIPLTITARDSLNPLLTYSQNFSLVVENPPASWNFAHQWAPNAYDVNADGVVSPLDAILVINQLNALGPVTYAAATGGTLAGHFFDVSGNDQLTPLDALLVIIRLNAVGSGEGEAAPIGGSNAAGAEIGKGSPFDQAAAYWFLSSSFGASSSAVLEPTDETEASDWDDGLILYLDE
jgi:hypothetical protein